MSFSNSHQHTIVYVAILVFWCFEYLKNETLSQKNIGITSKWMWPNESQGIGIILSHIVFPGRLQLLCEHRQIAAAHSTKDFLILFCLQCSTANGLLYFNLLKECTQSHNSSWEISDRKSSFSSAIGPNPCLPVIYKRIWRCFSLFPGFVLHLKLGSLYT